MQMHLPGFSAEASLYRTSRSYQVVPSSGGRDGAGGQVVPNLFIPWWCGPCLPSGWQYCCTAAPISTPCGWSVVSMHPTATATELLSEPSLRHLSMLRLLH